ncbi:hypothetical protein Hanom_Chr11g01027211 [Helianthus anomalus]
MVINSAIDGVLKSTVEIISQGTYVVPEPSMVEIISQGTTVDEDLEWDEIGDIGKDDEKHVENCVVKITWN